MPYSISLVVIKDRHCDPEYYAFENSLEAVAFAKRQVRTYYGADFVESEKHFVEYGDREYVGSKFTSGQLYFAEWSEEGGDHCNVQEVTFFSS